jgi:ABC-type phosphate transport system substrate-binding protein
MGDTRVRLPAATALMFLGLLAANPAMSTNAFGGGASLPASAYVGGAAVSNIFLTNVPGQTGGSIDAASMLGQWSATTGNKLAYCQTGSVNGKKIFDHFDGVTVLPGATGACTGTTSGFGALQGSVPDPHFAATSAPMTQAEFGGFASGGKVTAYSQPVQFPSLVGSIAIAFNNPDVAASSLNLSDSALCRIFSGAVTDWSQLSTAETGLAATLPFRAMHVTYRADGSGESFSLANHLSTVCLPDASGHRFRTDQSFTFVVQEFLSSIPTGWFPAGDERNAIAAIGSNVGSIGYVGAGNLGVAAGSLPASIRVANVNGFNPYSNLPVTTTYPSLLSDFVVVGTNPTGTPHIQAIAPTAPAPGCVLMVNPAIYANPAGQYPIVAVSYLIGNRAGNGADTNAVRSLFATSYGSHAGTSLIPGYSFVNAPAAAAKVTACINV